MLRRLFERMARGSNPRLAAPSRAGHPDDPEGPPVIVRHNTDGLQEHEKNAFNAMAAEATGIPIFEGRVEHAYDLAKFRDASKCPRCGGATELHYANFLYATQIAPRVMFVPAGYFCADCPSVIIDQELIEAGISDSRFRFQGVLGIDRGEDRVPDLFKTWNHESAVYVLDENEIPMGISALKERLRGGNVPPATAKSKQRKKNREKAAARTRRLNRRR
jgi:hypothetical protein